MSAIEPKKFYPSFAITLLLNLLLLAGAGLDAQTPTASPDAAVILTVMPFRSTGDAVSLNLGESFSETITTKLVGLRGLKVFERAQFDKVRGELNFQRDASDLVDQASVAKVGSVVSMDYLIVGSVTLAGTRIAAQIRLVKVKDGQALMSKQYDGLYPKGIFAMQDQMSLDLVAALKIRLDDLDKRRLSKPATENMDSWNLYNRSLGKLAIPDRISLLEKALSTDPGFIQAAQLLADLYLENKTADKSLRIYQSILAQDPRDYRSLYNSALLEFDSGHLDKARGLMERCLAEKDADPDVSYHLGLFSEYAANGERLAAGSDPKAALDHYRQALAVDPLHRESLMASGMIAVVLAQASPEPEAQLALLLESKNRFEHFLSLNPDEAEAAEASNALAQITSIIPQLQDFLAKRKR